MRVLLLHLDGRLPNLALMRIAAHHRELGDEVTLRRVSDAAALGPDLFEEPERVYASTIFEKTRPLVERVLETYPDALVGGTGYEVADSLEAHGITTTAVDYAVYPGFDASLGFTQRGCRLRCPFCVVPRKEGRVVEVQTIGELYRGPPWPRQVLLLDNDFFGAAHWRERVAELVAGDFRVCFCQGINVRLVDDEISTALARLRFMDSHFSARRLYVAWDSRRDERRFFQGMDRLRAAGIRPASIMVYMLVGFAPGETHADRDYRRARIRAFGALPYPMPYERTPELLGFQRWCIKGADKAVPWADFTAARWQLRDLPGGKPSAQLEIEVPRG